MLDMPGEVMRLMFKTQEQVDLTPSVYRISPDRKWYIYFEPSRNGTGSQIHISSIDGQESKVGYWNNNWGKSVEWLDNTRLIIWPTDDWMNGTVIVLNPFTGERQELKADKHVTSNLSITAPVIYYNPTLKQAIYQSGDSIYILWDIQSNQDVWMKRGANFLIRPSWSPDGSQFAFVVTDLSLRQSDIFLVKPDGQEIQLTHLTEAYPSISEIYVENLEWSPDGQQIAFSVFVQDKVNQIKGPMLMVVDINSKHIINYCVVVSEYSDGFIVWSPDSRQLVVASPIDYLEYIETAPKGVKQHVRVVLLDMVKRFAAQIAEDMAPMGWMVSP